ncbi:hypothetical protein HDU98_006834 [Podochytrium sp. JEL0797]|nr:hypothetical protein HDU98_006834 [Podochytrium sp. JEL0797]
MSDHPVDPSLAALALSLDWGLKFPTFCFGILINLIVLAIMVRKQKTLLKTRSISFSSLHTVYELIVPSLLNRIDLIYAFLMFVCFLWSVTEVALFAVWGNPDELVSAPKTRNQIIAATRSLPICLTIAGNIQLALERYSIFREVSWKSIRLTVYAYIAFAFCIIAVMITCFFTSPCSNQIFPDLEIQMILWVASASLGFLVGFASIIYFYSSTYSFIKKKLTTTLSDHHVDTLRMLLQRHVLRSSIIMTAGTLICYLPESVAITMLSMGLLNMNSVTGIVVVAVCFELVSLDVIITPALIVYFSEPLKNSIMSSFWGKGKRDVEDRDGSLLNEMYTF